MGTKGTKSIAPTCGALALPAALPGTWQEAIARASASAFLADALGADFLRIFLAIKRQECARYSAEVTELDRAWYSGTV